MSSTLYSCKGCVGSDPTQDTVKNIMEMYSMLSEHPNKENIRPQQQTIHDQKAQRERVQKVAERIALQEELRHKGELAAAAIAEEQRQAKELQEARMEAQSNAMRENERRQRQAKELEEARKQAQSKATGEIERRQRQAKELEEARKEAQSKVTRQHERRVHFAAAADAGGAAPAGAGAAAAVAAAAAEEDCQRQEIHQCARDRQENREKQEAEIRALQLAVAKIKVGQWCKINGFYGMNTPKQTLRGASKFPLHTAAKHNNEEMIAMLLMCGVDKYALDSKKQTAHEVAAKMNKNGCSEMILARLR